MKVKKIMMVSVLVVAYHCQSTQLKEKSATKNVEQVSTETDNIESLESRAQKNLLKNEKYSKLFKGKSIGIFNFDNKQRKAQYKLGKILPILIYNKLKIFPELKLITSNKLNPKKETEEEKKNRRRRRIVKKDVYTPREAMQIAEDLNIDYVLTGKITEKDNILDIQLTLYDISSKSVYWKYHSNSTLKKLVVFVQEFILNFSERFDVKNNWQLLFQILNPLTSVDDMQKLLIASEKINPSNSNNATIKTKGEDIIKLDPLSLDAYEFAKEGDLHIIHKNIIDKFVDNYYNKAKVTRTYYLFYKSLYRFINILGSKILINYKVIDKSYIPDLINSDQVIGTFKVKVERSFIVDRYIKLLLSKYNLDYEVVPLVYRPPRYLIAQSPNTDMAYNNALLLKASADVPFWDYIFENSDIDSGDNYWSKELPRISRAGFYFDFKVMPLESDLNDSNNDVGTYLFGVGPGVFEDSNGEQILAKSSKGNQYIGEILLSGLALNNSHLWSRAEKSKAAKNDEFPSATQELSFRSIEFYTFSYNMQRKDINKPLALQLTSGSTNPSIPLVQDFDMTSLFNIR